MARTLEDLTYFTRSIIGMKPWDYDHSVHPIEWRASEEEEIQKKKVLRIGVMSDDGLLLPQNCKGLPVLTQLGVITPSPACARALSLTTTALAAAGHIVLPLHPPSPYVALLLASQLLLADGGRTFLSYFRSGEWQDSGVAQLTLIMSLPTSLRYFYYLYVKYIRRDNLYAALIRDLRGKTVAEQWALVAEREAYKATWHEWWTHDAQIDLLLTVPNATPAVPNGGMRESVSSCGYTFMFNLLDYVAGVLPVTKVDRHKDRLPDGFDLGRLNGVARGAYQNYDAEAMDGLPVGVQVVGQRLQEEKVLAGMKRVEDALREFGPGTYEQLSID
jgi:Asp-tRNA(Asn)/Glu-tRNA(Gln) amidotransferase A subunit family amidase